ncbi:hypothetical protein N658DRAFT_563636 [Parathielavia hyrcaniae]|uniref:NADH dehydrogenase [ubiquinone] 1 alpha subcomplex assembly factor 3 n=1 Tax=Parathielavia hyrcaniae TaxID=113614 RepID=A0AAN6QB42_9PEZI|nr:hypothetical protein N658DRAFT_563636 [Parathielavia hyrcaniae]
MVTPSISAARRLPATVLRALRPPTTPSNTTATITTVSSSRRPSPFQPSNTTTSPSNNLRLPASSSSSRRAIHTTRPAAAAQSSRRSRKPPLAHNAEPVPDQPPTTDFGAMDVLASAPVPTTAVEVCHADGFSLNSGVHIGGGSGALLVSGEAFCWRPWEILGGSGGGDGMGTGTGMGMGNRRGKRLVNERGQWEVGEEAFGVLGVVWPRPDLLILGLGPEIRPLSPATRRAINNLGMRVEVLDTRNAVNQYNMLATERGMGDVAAALIPIGWKDGA